MDDVKTQEVMEESSPSDGHREIDLIPSEAEDVKEQPKHEDKVPYDRFKQKNEEAKREKEAREDAERRALEAEQRIAEYEERQRQSEQPKSKEKQYSLQELENARRHWITEGEFDKAMEIADMINDRKLDEKVRLVAADIEDRYRAEADNPDLRDRSSELYREASKVFNEQGNLTRSQAAEIAYARLSRAGKLKQPQKEREKYEPKGQLGSGTQTTARVESDLDQSEMALCDEMGINPDSYKKQKLEAIKRGAYATQS